ncbi:MAG TPA: hypothetical protein VFE58_01215 [Tepidisphaeraceae bacterium]|nr:hypothetical protein [Tepidisphaeraceae bacterium]
MTSRIGITSDTIIAKAATATAASTKLGITATPAGSVTGCHASTGSAILHLTRPTPAPRNQ